MNNGKSAKVTQIVIVLSVLLLSGCASQQPTPAGAIQARQQLSKLQASAELAELAPVAIRQADEAVQAAERPTKDQALSTHLIFVADRKVNIAWAQAQDKFGQDQRKLLADARDSARLDSRTREADLARTDASIARNEAERARDDALQARDAAEQARNDAALAQQQIDSANSQAADLQAQIVALNAKATERGLVVTLGDVLFDTAQSNLKASASSHLANLAAFLKTYPERGVIIEGHTDSVGNEDYNYGLSQRRADSVQGYLLGQGIAASRITTSGKGETLPIAGNDTASGRQQNRRVEVIISNGVTAAK
ncbi:MAG: OmpA family protein [Gammaproteobacteria bacterium]|jgi:outer membrane protein OmpA-like peptidoglycan-associated protein|nr:OmpA family protein [Gammaproteobacteria bacterium]MBU2178134.1 OmpA family protein [Gammaproteobacteria bacterium]MBU2225060.1 OmpA family protein [Gammaproteobacteria bacterium]MBU2278836.1 OmpA family protein [Gammaproteobacteria bacterium]MBU2428011.1 OmpA family protein [Gammaproteobacteria bacterium]